jgi:hypothetical protein
MADSEIVSPDPSPRVVRLPSGERVRVPDDWSLLPPGDATLTRRVKAAGTTLVVQEKRGRKTFSRGVWAPTAHIEGARANLEAERDTPAYQKRLGASRQRRAVAQERYVETFESSVVEYLGFHPRYAELARRMAQAITAHATPVGSGTVARTERIPIERRAEAAVIAWMRHQTTGYDGMVIPRVKGARREVRRLLAKRSKALLQRYRRGDDPAAGCPLAAVLGR